jgi:hypothetical protein
MELASRRCRTETKDDDDDDGDCDNQNRAKRHRQAKIGPRRIAGKLQLLVSEAETSRYALQNKRLVVLACLVRVLVFHTLGMEGKKRRAYSRSIIVSPVCCKGATWRRIFHVPCQVQGKETSVGP